MPDQCFLRGIKGLRRFERFQTARVSIYIDRRRVGGRGLQRLGEQVRRQAGRLPYNYGGDWGGKIRVAKRGGIQ